MEKIIKKDNRKTKQNHNKIFKSDQRSIQKKKNKRIKRKI